MRTKSSTLKDRASGRCNNGAGACGAGIGCTLTHLYWPGSAVPTGTEGRHERGARNRHQSSSRILRAAKAEVRASVLRVAQRPVADADLLVGVGRDAAAAGHPIASVRAAEAEAAAKEGKATSLLGLMNQSMRQGGNRRQRTPMNPAAAEARQKQFDAALKRLFADPYAWADETSARLTTVPEPAGNPEEVPTSDVPALTA